MEGRKYGKVRHRRLHHLKKKSIFKTNFKGTRNIRLVNNLYRGEALQREDVNLAGAHEIGFQAPSQYVQEQSLRFHGYVVPGGTVSAISLRLSRR